MLLVIRTFFKFIFFSIISVKIFLHGGEVDFLTAYFLTFIGNKLMATFSVSEFLALLVQLKIIS